MYCIGCYTGYTYYYNGIYYTKGTVIYFYYGSFIYSVNFSAFLDGSSNPFIASNFIFRSSILKRYSFTNYCYLPYPKVGNDYKIKSSKAGSFFLKASDLIKL